MSRGDVAQLPPASDLDLSGFPREVVESTREVFRAHSAGRHPWYFSSDNAGRFNLDDPRGTCYLADTIRAAVRERVGEQFVNARFVAPEDAQRMRVSRLALPLGLCAADLEAPRVAEYPVTGELSTMGDYRVTRAWAEAFADAGFEGIHYRGRFSHFEGNSSWAVFGAAGAHDEAPTLVRDELDGFEACAVAGMRVLPAPPSEVVGLSIVKAPRGGGKR